ncbi:hypothetical protein [Lacinutrix sp. Bg11-31]|uniref:hypothetical protein n=1 Tax=Lacinutrix sp. Bg11-31 TaxID=2057808 RepID=UPI000C308CD0|nr:hypothetical protein [Lacinutrix sp. Bg11-31]AUC82833.1 hypothetical protein CW733_12150 [Lacinutrix sp. Bg11-31]
MKKNLITLLIFTLVFSCKNKENKKLDSIIKTEFIEIIKDDYILNKPVKDAKAVLVLFGGFPENAGDIKREFKIIENAEENNIAVLYLNYSRKIWLTKKEKTLLSEQLQNIFKENKLPSDNVYIGGFSSGGNMALLISNFITHENSSIIPKGVFIVDSPLDLYALHTVAKKNVERNFSEPAVQESMWLIETLEKQLGKPEEDISKYEEYSVATLKTGNIDNIKNLKETKIRFYTEPDTLWWKKNRFSEYDEMNAYYIKKLHERLSELKFNAVEYIPTENKGYRANGERHPHSWSIVDKTDLVHWMLNK